MNTLFQLISHEYRKYVFTRGFLLFILILPLSGAFGYFASQISENAAPIRTFTVVDETGEYIRSIDEALANSSARRQLSAWDEYASNAVARDADGNFPLSYPFIPGRQTAARRADFITAGGMAAALTAAEPYLIDNAGPAPEVRDLFVRVDVPTDAANAEGESQNALLRAYVRGDISDASQSNSLFAAVVIPSDFPNSDEGVRFYTNNLIDRGLRDFVDETLTDAVKAQAYEQRGVDAKIVKDIEQISIPVRLYKANSEDGSAAGSTEFLETSIPLGLAYFQFLMIVSIGGMLLTSTVEEKSNKIVEVLLSSVSAPQLMASKLIGLALVGITIPMLFLSAGYLATEIISANAVAGSDLAGLIEVIKTALFESPLIPLFFFYFLVGYLLFASIYLAVGAMCNSIQDAQTFVAPLTILLILPAPFLMMVVNDPNGIIARVLTWIPLYTPYAIMIRMSSEPPMWEIMSATGLLMVFVLIVVTMMGRIYRNGVLSSGGAPTLKQVRELARAGN